MKVFHCHNDLEKMRPPPQVFGVVKQELDKLLEISGGVRIDPANGRVFLFEPGDCDQHVEAEFGRVFTDLLFEGVIRCGSCWVGYLAHDNQNLSALIIPAVDLCSDWLAVLNNELGGGL
jgi:hypothetical protein